MLPHVVRARSSLLATGRAVGPTRRNLLRPGQGGPIAPKGMDEFPRPCAPATRFLAISMSVVLRSAHGVSLPRRRGGGLRLETTGAAEAELWLPPCRLSCLLGASPSEDGGRRVDTSELLIARAGPGRLSGREVQGYVMVEGQRAGTKRFVPAEGAWRRSSPPVWAVDCRPPVGLSAS